MSTYTIHEGDASDVLRTLPAGSVQTVITSPPYWGLRDYGTATWEGGDVECDHVKLDAERIEALTRGSTLGGGPSPDNHEFHRGQYRTTCGKCGAHRIDGQLGLEPTPEEYVERLVAIFREVRRVLRDDGTVWLNLGDSYAANGAVAAAPDNKNPKADARRVGYRSPVLKGKDLVGIPWRVAFALQADGWYLRSDIIWAKPNPMPESVTDRPTKAHEYLFLLAKSARYYFDADAVRETDHGKPSGNGFVRPHRLSYGDRGSEEEWEPGGGRNIRSVWNIATHPYPGAHFATFPPKLVEPCVRAGSAIGTTVLDPFAGAGTCGMVALREGRDFIGIELNPTYAQMARDRIWDDGPLLNVEAT